MLEKLKKRMEKEIEQLLTTLVDIEKYEKEKPGRELSNRAQVALGMIWQSVLMRSVWKDFEKHSLPFKERMTLVKALWKATYNHYKELYWFDTKKKV